MRKLHRAYIYYQTAADTGGGAGWAYDIKWDDGSFDSGGIETRRRDARLKTLRRAFAREMRRNGWTMPSSLRSDREWSRDPGELSYWGRP